MTTLLFAAGGAIVGGATGFWLGLQEGGDFNFAPLFYSPIGALVGTFGGIVLAEVIK